MKTTKNRRPRTRNRAGFLLAAAFIGALLCACESPTDPANPETTASIGGEV